jgi:hypothetical protein
MMEFESVSTKFLEGPTSSKKTAPQSTAGKIMPELATMMGNRFTTGGVEDTSLMVKTEGYAHHFSICYSPF